MKDLVPVVVGFVLTTVLGGALGFFFQRRSWTHQHEVQFAEQERERAVRIFEEVSRIMDKRLYRLRLIHWSLAADGDDDTGSRALNARMEDYRQALYEWNDNINRNLALVQQYFGIKMRNRLDRAIGASFVALGEDVEALWKAKDESGEGRRPENMDQRINELSTLVYVFNLDMIRAVQSGAVGWLVQEIAEGASKSPASSRYRPNRPR